MECKEVLKSYNKFVFISLILIRYLISVYAIVTQTSPAFVIFIYFIYNTCN